MASLSTTLKPQGSLGNRSSRCQSLLPACPSWSWSLQACPKQRRPASIHCDKDDPASKRPRLQAQRKFAQSPPSSPGPSVLMTSAQSNHNHNLATVSCLTRRRPKTEDFLSFLCLRGSAALPSNMAFLGSGRQKKRGDRHITSCVSTSHSTLAEGKNLSMFTRTKVLQDSRSLRGKPGGPFCPLTARAQRRRERERREEEQQQRRREGVGEDRRVAAKRNLLRPRQLSLQVAKVSGLSQQRMSCVRSIPPLKPSTGVGSRRSLRSRTRPTTTCKPKSHPQSRFQETNNKHLPRNSSHQLPHNNHLSLHHRTVSNYYSNPETLSSLQNSGRNPSKTSAQIPLTNGSVIREISENHGVLRFSRRRRGLPPDTSPTSQNQPSLDKNSTKKCKTMQYNNADVVIENHCHIGETPQNEARCDKGEEHVSHTDMTACSHNDQCGDVGEMRLEKDLQNKVTVKKLSLTSITAAEPSQEGVTFTSAITSYDLSPVSEVICRQMREKRLQRNQPTVPKPVTRTADSRTVSRGATARTILPKDKINSVMSTCAHTDPPASYSAKHTPKVINKGSRKDNNKCTSVTSSYTISINSQVAGKDSSMGVTEDFTKSCAPVSSYSSTSKGSIKSLTQTKCTTSSIKTRTSPRILLKR
ncbi:uncharacterized protein LOC113169903 isoform X2 [Anabas testudineus]|uniref:PP1-binding domain-containing protein n=1 Tax=Anabas testudineus TaxID=64144 RepID=A0AAQ6IPI3_ANATE|nr:uncharacterized protein LOC113169903 isoform X2 [Anabas testudineus]XP_026227467.1 uncharacterized protein LOC113169903 isoform X2 [Anabas testudineus]XP_026227468.1 uncharacterized protein LOC113169903 isoform X2 [Anabas testudineus]